MNRRRKLGTIAFVLVLLVSLIAGFYPVNHPEATENMFNAGDIAWMLTASALVLIMTPGLSFFYGGMVRPKHIISTMLQSFVALGVISLIWYVVGFSLAFGDSIYGIIGNPLTYFMMNNVGSAPDSNLSPTLPFLLFAAFQLKFAIITPALITGSFAERVKFWGYLVFMCLFSVVIYAPLAHWTWHPEGFLHRWGVLDFAGGTVVHIAAGVAALAGAIYMGPRATHKAEFHTPSVPYVLLGTGLLWFGWFGFNAGSAMGANELAVSALFTTNLASASAMITWILFDVAKGHRPSAMGASIGAVVGLVAITPAAGFVDFGPAILIGTISALVSHFAVHWKSRSEIDDTLDVFPCHGVGGISGMILTGVFAKDVGLIYGETQTFLYHLLGLVIVCVFVYGMSMLLYRFTALITPLRVSELEEELGLDISQHEESVYEEYSYRTVEERFSITLEK